MSIYCDSEVHRVERPTFVIWKEGAVDCFLLPQSRSRCSHQKHRSLHRFLHPPSRCLETGTDVETPDGRPHQAFLQVQTAASVQFQ